MQRAQQMKYVPKNTNSSGKTSDWLKRKGADTGVPGLEFVESMPRSKRGGTLVSSKLWAHLTEVFDWAQANGVCPYEERLKITPSLIQELDGLKNARATLMAQIRKQIKLRNLKKVLELHARGEDLYLQGVGM